MEFSIPQGDSRAEWKVPFSPHGNIFTIARMKTFIICFIKKMKVIEV
jgi:hypothetical protein